MSSPPSGSASGSGKGRSSAVENIPEMVGLDKDNVDKLLTSQEYITPISLKLLESDDADEEDLNARYLDLVLLRVINPASSGGNVNIYKKQKTGSQSTVKYTRLFLLKIHAPLYPDQNKRLVYMFVNRTSNRTIWNNNINNRDNGNITIGCFFRVISPSPIIDFLRNEVPVLLTNNPLILLKPPLVMIPVPMTDRIESNESLGFVLIKCSVTSMQHTVIATKCGGCFCDRQRVMDWMNVKGCGCYGMSAFMTNLAINHAIKVKNDDQEKPLKMTGFSSQKFNQLFMTGEIPIHCKVAVFELTEAFFKLSKCIKKCLAFINLNGGFIVLGWYKRGEINDASIVEADAVENAGNDYATKNSSGEKVGGSICYHFVHIRPFNPDFVDKKSKLSQDLYKLKYNVCDIKE